MIRQKTEDRTQAMHGNQCEVTSEMMVILLSLNGDGLGKFLSSVFCLRVFRLLQIIRRFSTRTQRRMRVKVLGVVMPSPVVVAME